MTKEEVLRIGRLLAWGFASLLWAIPHGQAQVTTDQLNSELNAVTIQILTTKDQSKLSILVAREQSLVDELTTRNRAQLQENTVKMEKLATTFQSADKPLQDIADKKWCHTNPWRWIRRYRKPDWCRQ